MDARMNNLEEALRQITQSLANAGLMNNDRPNNQHNPNLTPRNHEDRTIRIDIYVSKQLNIEPMYM